MMENDLMERLFVFAVRTLKFTRKLPNTTEYKIIRNQLAKSSTSSGANYEEAQGGSSKADFINKVKISLHEMRESNYWLRIIDAIKEEDTFESEIQFLLKESSELKKILGAIMQKTRQGK
ncbi:MAG: four helix bundle protein [Bacteroidetes bacterium RIFOXYA12_FULL_35_11]|nr:MAG: four helix bundle protein [Bacteroidetes bacterium GWF2_35_48]OFY73236.1 MAG: four helix bundle protein [Bacteroidetes bacterium RIFOXYA12_FULL_35_11]OFY94639.1 MAG: four helix bundle protein [Bacteroidetes bacterium RIFOXYC12_FULL_35_7]HBX53519.1 four helix bundle protein [Bacteroidales bacterium]